MFWVSENCWFQVYALPFWRRLKLEAIEQYGGVGFEIKMSESEVWTYFFIILIWPRFVGGANLSQPTWDIDNHVPSTWSAVGTILGASSNISWYWALKLMSIGQGATQSFRGSRSSYLQPEAELIKAILIIITRSKPKQSSMSSCEDSARSRTLRNCWPLPNVHGVGPRLVHMLGGSCGVEPPIDLYLRCHRTCQVAGTCQLSKLVSGRLQPYRLPSTFLLCGKFQCRKCLTCEKFIWKFGT